MVVVKALTPKLWLRYWVHIFALAATTVLAALNFLNIHFIDTDRGNAQAVLNIFQFVAKAHELLIIGSLMLIMMDLIRSRLVTMEGVPLGYVLAPMLFNDIDWLMSSKFWFASRPSASSVPLVFLMLTAIPFANLAGPLSAIAIVPRPGYSHALPADFYPSIFNRSASKIWPSTVSGSLLPEECSHATPKPWLTEPCPPSMLDTLLYSFTREPLCTVVGPQVTCNATVAFNTSASLPGMPFIPRYLATEYDARELSVYSSTPTDILYETFAFRYSAGILTPQNISNTIALDARKIQLLEVQFLGDAKMANPVVNSTCRQLNYSEIYATSQQQTNLFSFSNYQITMLGDADGSGKPSVLFSFRKDDALLLKSAEKCSGEECYMAIECNIDARWATMDLWANTAVQTQIFQSDPQPKKLFESGRLNNIKPILLEKDWREKFLGPGLDAPPKIAALINTWNPPLEGTVQQNYFPSIGGAQQNTFLATNYAQAVAFYLSISVIESLSRLSSLTGTTPFLGDCSTIGPEFTSAGFTFPKEMCNTRPTDWIDATTLGDLGNTISTFSLTVRREGYGWFLNSSITLRLALAALLLHGLITIVYLLGTLATKRTVTTCWSSAPEILMLAVNSLRAPVLMGHSTGKASNEVWRESVCIREIDSGEELSLVVGDGMDYSGRVGEPPELGKKYL